MKICRTFASVSSLRRWLERKLQECEGQEAFFEWLTLYFENGDEITVNGEPYGFWACWELVECAAGRCICPTRKGESNMTNTELLRRKIKESGYKVGFLAEKMGITYHGLLNKINNRSDFRARELAMLAGLLQLPREEWFAVFFAGEAEER